MPDGFVQQDPRPPGTQYHWHLACRSRAAIEVHQRLTQSLIDRAPPGAGLRDEIVREAPAGSVTAGFTAAALLHHQRYIQPDKGPEVGDPRAVGPHDLHRLPLPTDRRHDLLDAR